jgi:dipeptidyl aminopeptidase/acylaminoacyl peptidase
MPQLIALTSTDSIYTERYMHTPQHNAAGYDNTSITDVQSLSKNVRFLIMHGIADDNVHMQNTLTLLDKLDLAGIENYDVHVFPDSDHSIYFHNANKIVYDSKNSNLKADILMLTLVQNLLGGLPTPSTESGFASKMPYPSRS